MHVKLEEIKEAAREDFNTFAALVLGDEFHFDFPPEYIALAEKIIASSHEPRDFSKFGVGLPRGFAKTTWAKILICYLLCFSTKRFIGIAAANETMATNVIGDIWNFLQAPNIKAIFGDCTADVIQNSKELKQFRFCNRTIVIAGVGANGSPRGWNINNSRPDFLLMDDVQTRDCAASDADTARLFTWIFATFLYTRSPFGCTTLFLGNMYPGKNSVLQKLSELKNWTTFIVGGILADGTSLWEELFPIKLLMDDYSDAVEAGREDIFLSEILNSNAALQKIPFTPDKFKPVPGLPDELPQAKFLIIDPSGEGKKSDATAIGLFYLWEGKPALRKIDTGSMSPKETILRALTLALNEGATVIAVENVSYQATLLFWFNEFCAQAGIEGLSLVPINPKGRSKPNRIKLGINQIVAGEIFVYPEVQVPVYNEIKVYAPASKTNVDNILDIVAYAPDVVQEYQHLMEMPLSGQYRMLDYDRIPVLSHTHTSNI